MNRRERHGGDTQRRDWRLAVGQQRAADRTCRFRMAGAAFEIAQLSVKTSKFDYVRAGEGESEREGGSAFTSGAPLLARESRCCAGRQNGA